MSVSPYDLRCRLTPTQQSRLEPLANVGYHAMLRRPQQHPETLLRRLRADSQGYAGLDARGQLLQMVHGCWELSWLARHGLLSDDQAQLVYQMEALLQHFVRQELVTASVRVRRTRKAA